MAIERRAGDGGGDLSSGSGKFDVERRDRRRAGHVRIPVRGPRRQDEPRGADRRRPCHLLLDGARERPRTGRPCPTRLETEAQVLDHRERASGSPRSNSRCAVRSKGSTRAPSGQQPRRRRRMPGLEGAGRKPRARRSTFPTSAFETGQPTFASSAAARNASSSIPSTCPRHGESHRGDAESALTLVEDRDRIGLEAAFGGWPACAKPSASAIERQVAWAAAIFGAGLAAGVFESRRERNLLAADRPAADVEPAGSATADTVPSRVGSVAQSPSCASSSPLPDGRSTSGP